MNRARAAAAACLCLLLLLPTGLLPAVGAAAGSSSLSGPAPVAAVRAPFPFAPGEAMREPDFLALDGASDLPVHPPPSSRGPLAAPVNWTVLVYMVADNDLEPFALQDINEMEAASAAAGVRVVVQIDRSSRYDNASGDWNGTRRYLIGHDNDASTITSTLIADLGELNMGDPQTLADFLAWGFDTYPAARYLVDLWNHGYGWSGGFGNDLGNNDHLSLSELALALEAAAEHLGRPLDILAFDACLMQQMEVAYEFARIADYLVAAEDLEPAAGWPYDAMLAPLAADPSAAPGDVAGRLVEAYLDYYGLQGEAMMSATRLSTVRTALFDAMNALALQLSPLVESRATAPADSAARAMWDARDLSPSMFNGDLIDLGEFTRRLSEDPRLPDAARASAALAREALNSSVVAEGHTVYRPGLSGLSVYLPSVSLPSRYAITRFASEGQWDEFLAAMLSGVPGGGARPTLQVLSPSEGIAVARRFGASLSADTAAGEAVRVQVKAGWGDFADVAVGFAPLQASAVLDAGRDAGPVVLSFRALSAQGVPSATVERRVLVEPPPVVLAPALDEIALAVNRTRTLMLDATPRAPFLSFDIAWVGLPSGVSGAGTTSSVTLTASPPPPFSITVGLATDAAASEGSFPATLVVRPTAAPSVVTYLDVVITVTRPLPDVSVAPMDLSNDLPLPGEVVTATTTVSNVGFEDVAAARVIAEFTDGFGNLTELANISLGALLQGDARPFSVNFTAVRGVSRLVVRAAAEPSLTELSAFNNLQERVIVIVNLSVSLSGPGGQIPALLGDAAGPPPITSIALGVHNLGTDADRYDLAVLNLSNATWQAALSTAQADVPARTNQNLSVDVLPSTAAQGGDGFSFVVRATSQADPNISASLLVEVEVTEVFAANVTPQPNDVSLQAGGSLSVTLLVQNRGNGRETFALLIEGGDEKLQTSLDRTTLGLARGAGGSAHLTLTDAGLVSADRPYTLEAVALSLASGARFSAIVSVSVRPSPSLAVEPLEPRVDTGASGAGAFHVRVRNTGNTNLIAAVSAAASHSGLSLNLSESALLIEPGASFVVNGSVNFSAPPLAGLYPIAVSASDDRTGANATASLEMAVPVVHDLRASVTVSPAEGRTLVRTVIIENHGNAPEPVSVVVGYVPVGTRFEVDPPNDTIVVAARGEMRLTVRIEGPSGEASRGTVEVVLRAQGGSVVLPLSVAFEFAAPPTAPLLAWLAIGAASAGALGAWMWVTRPGGPTRPRKGA